MPCLRLQLPRSATIAVEPVISDDAGTTWVAMADPLPMSLRAGLWTNARAQGAFDLLVGESVRFGLRVTRLAGTADPTDSRCHLRAVVGNRNGAGPPF